MKILLIDISTKGHHKTYISSLINSENEYVICTPEKFDDLKCKQVILKVPCGGGAKEYFEYLNWIISIRKICREEKPDIVHFVYADFLYKFFGFGLFLIGKNKILSTVHFVRSGKLRQFSLKLIAKQSNRIVVHSDYLLNSVKKLGIDNGVHIEYPQFNLIIKDKDESLDFFGMKKNIPVLLCIGNTRVDKGLDVLLEALNNVNKPFQLLIAGKEEVFDKKYIEEHSLKYSDKVFTCLHFLTDEEFSYAVGASDIVVLPYKKFFNGSSGPLGEGVAQNKCIVGPSHGNLSHTICQNHLGYIFETESVNSLTEVLNKALCMNFVPDDMYLKYKESLNPSYFEKKYAELYQE